MRNRILLQSVILLFLTICLTVAVQKPDNYEKRKSNEIYDEYKILLRSKRATQKPGFFRTLFSVIFEQWNDTKQTFGKVNELVNNNFLPDNPPVTKPTTANPNVSTTEAPYRISRAEFQKILSRNLKGLQRLYNIELQEALKESENYRKEFRKNATKEISKFL